MASELTLLSSLSRWEAAFESPDPLPVAVERLRAATAGPTALFEGTVEATGFSLRPKLARFAFARRETAGWDFEGRLASGPNGTHIQVRHGGAPGWFMRLATAGILGFTVWAACTGKGANGAVVGIGLLIVLWWTLLLDTRHDRRTFVKSLQQALGQ